MNKEIVIVGKGIAGLTLSYLLAQKQLRHTVLHRAGEPAGFALAETLPPSAIPMLRRMGLLALFESSAIRQTYGYHSLWGTSRVTDHNFYFQYPGAYGLKINKQALLSKLENQQAKYLSTDESALSAGKLIVDATGRARSVLRGMDIGSLDNDGLIAYSCHVPYRQHPALTHSVYTESFRDGWGIVSRLNEKENVITLFTDRYSTIGIQLKHYPNWPEVLLETTNLHYFLTGDENTRVKGHIANSSRALQIAGENWLAIGDAAIAFDPLSSHGITNAIYTAGQAAIAVERYIRAGDSVAIPTYGNDMITIFDQYLLNKDQLYRQEKRWPESPFWQNRQTPSAQTIPPSPRSSELRLHNQ